MNLQSTESWGFCGSNFWNSSLSWDTSNPDLTVCFERTALVWTPCAFLWILAPIEFYYLRHSKAKRVPWSFLNLAKLAVAIGLSLLSLADIGYAVYLKSEDEEKVYDVSYYTPAVLFMSEILSALLLIYNRKKGSITSGLLFFFWLLLLICGVFQFRSGIIKATEEKSYAASYYFISYMVYYPLVFIQFILHCFADSPSSVFNQTDIKKVSPELTSSSLSRLLFAWFDKFIWLGYRKPLEMSDLWPMNPEDTAEEVIPKFDEYWNKLASRNSRNLKVQGFPEGKLKEISIIWPIIKAFGGTFLFGALLKLINDCLAFVNPHVLELLINYVENGDFEWKGYFYALIMLISATMQTILLSQYYKRMSLVGLRIRTALISAIYRKSLRLSNAAKRDSTTGEIVNLMAVDAQRFIDLLTYINLIWAAPFQIILALYFLWDLLGISVLAGLAVMILLIPVNFFIAKKVKALQIKQMMNKDERVKITNEVLNGIKVLKFYCWEPSFEKRILETRNKEIKVLKAAAYFNAGTSFIWACAPFLVSLATLGTYVFLDDKNRITASIAFVSLNYFNIMRYPMGSLPMLINIYVQTYVSVQRINKYLNSEELNPNTVSHIDSDSDPLTIENGTFTWDPDEKPTLKNINLQIKNGQLVAVVGAVGSGKSSLISAFLGEMEKVTGRVNTKGSIAYVPQQAWIQNATLKDNILFGKTLDGKVYNSVVDACALKPDFDMLPAGDRTEIGEKGINLSGGQKQRVSLARAIYHDSDVYFLDDPLSAVDSHVGKHIFEKVIGPAGILKDKTRILVTHGVTYLPDVDLIVVLKDGEVSETGTYKELVDKKGAFAEFLSTYHQEKEDSDSELQKNLSPQPESKESDTPDVISADDESENAKKNVLIEKEKAEIGSVKWMVYSHYLKSMGIILATITLLMNVAFQGFSIGSHIWLSEWTSINSTDTATRNKYLGVYGGLGIGQAVTSFLASICLAMGMVRASKFLHENILSRNFHAPMSFFDTTPIGRIVNRFSKDIDTVDNTLPYTIRHWVDFLFTVIATLVVISYTTPLFIAIIIPIGILYYFIQRFYIATSRQLQRMESVSRSPIYSHFGETVTGTQTIRAYNVQSRFIRESEEKVDLNQICYYPSIIANRWLAVRLEMIGNLIMFLSALFAVLNRDTMNSGLVGLSVTYALQVTDTLSWLVRTTSDVETNIVAVERIKEYEETPQEAPWDNPDNKTSGDWPKNGDVEFVDYKVRYRENLDLVLRGLTFRVIGGEKVGIVGRTGAGKSSLTLALFRIIEAANGKILIDGIDISKLGLHDLRTRLTIVPQDPVLFSGTVRMNLDPFNKYTDEEIWRALENANLKTFVQQLTLKLDHEVSEGGENLSVGQRQLVCLARALLRKTKILILDEATAAVDLETDDLIQKTIRSEFKDCTVLTIAHRLNTILDSDKVIVLNRGLIVEFDNPQKLLAQSESVFYSMAKDANIA